MSPYHRRSHSPTAGAEETDPPSIRAAAQSLDPGQAVCVRWNSPGGKVTTGIIVRETRDRLRSLGKHPKLALRCALLQSEHVLPLVVLLQAAGQEEMTYEVWIDHYAPDGPQIFKELIEQKNLVICFYTASKRWRRIPVYNHHKLSRNMHACRRQCQSASPWSREEFQRARENLFLTYPTVQDLWRIKS